MKGYNHRLLRFFSASIEDHPAEVTEDFACFKVDLDTTIKDELSSTVFDSLFADCKQRFCYDENKQARKNPLVVQTIIKEAARLGKKSSTLKRIVNNILELKKKDENLESSNQT